MRLPLNLALLLLALLASALGETGPDRALNPRYVFVYATQPSLPAP